MTKRKIVIPLEVSDISAEILPVVRQLFEAEKTELTLIAVAQPLGVFLARDIHMMELPPPGYVTRVTEQEWEIYKQGIEERLHRMARHLQEAGYKVTPVLRTGSTVQEIANFVQQGDFDLLAMATFGRKGLNRLLFGSVAEELLRLVSIPMLLLRHQVQPKEETTPGDKLAQRLSQDQRLNIAVATDGDDHAQNTVRLACTLMEALRSNLKVLVMARARDGAAHGQQVMQRVQSWVRDLEPQPEFVPLVGPPDETLGHYWEKNAVDLLVLGAFADRGAGGPAHIGLTAQRAVQHAPMSVLVVKGWQTNIKRILACVAVDDMAVIDGALQLARALNAELQLIHILPAAGQARSSALSPDDLTLRAILERDAHLSSFLHKARETLNEAGHNPATLQMWRGEILKTILDVAKNDPYDLIVVGNHSGASFFLDTMAHAVVSYAAKPVLIVRTRAPAE
jgi:nucleotide-binding universal stress UspA family protein